MKVVGIDIGSTATKVFIKGSSDRYFVVPSGWNSKETATLIKERLIEDGSAETLEDTYVVATGYGRGAVDYANKTVTEISCHARGGSYLSKKDVTIIDIGGQDTKVILVENGQVVDFLMNDKCSAGNVI